MFTSFRNYICAWNFVDALHFWIEIGNLDLVNGLGDQTVAKGEEAKCTY